MWRMAPKRSLSRGDRLGRQPSCRARPCAPCYAASRGTIGIDVSEAEKPLAEYSGFDEFFTRRLRAGARPIDATPGAVVSPADGTVVDCGVASAGKLIQAKGVLFELSGSWR